MMSLSTPDDAADHGVLAGCAHTGVHARQTADDRVLADMNVTAQRDRIGQDHMILDDAVMSDMATDHEKAV